MKRWNGWGDESISVSLSSSASDYLQSKLGPGKLVPDVSITQMLNAVPASRLPDHPLVSHDAEQRLRHARGHSLPDWIDLRHGCIDAYPDGVAFPESDEQVRALLAFAQKQKLYVIPYGGGTSVVGHINPLPSQTPTLTISLARLDRLREFDATSCLATVGAGITGPKLESTLRYLGFTLGHYPQSFEYSTLGGWIATRSSGQQSYYYGRIEALFAGGQMETPAGPLFLPSVPATAAGPDLRDLILGSEGRLGIITYATVRVQPIPEREQFYGAFFHEWEEGVQAVRSIAQANIPVSMLRLSDAQETETTLVLAGKENLVGWAERGLNLLRYGSQRCLLLYGLTGSASLTRAARRAAHSIIRRHGGLLTGKTVGNVWSHSRFRNPYLRNTLWNQGYAIDTLETAIPWKQVVPLASALKESIRAARNAPVLVFAHLSHVYPDGASIYVTYLFPRMEDPVGLRRRWHEMKRAASQTIVEYGATISHQHGVGLDHAAYLPAEKGPMGMAWLEQSRRLFDPDTLMNPGKLLNDAPEL